MQAAGPPPTCKRGKWAKIFDAVTHKRYYYFDVETKKSQWTAPPDWAALAHLEIVVPPKPQATKQQLRVATGDGAAATGPASPAVKAALAAAKARAMWKAAAAAAGSGGGGGGGGAGPKVRINLSLDGAGFGTVSAAKLQRKAEKKAMKQALKAAGKKGKKGGKKGGQQHNALYCPICDVAANNAAQLREHKAGRKHQNAMDTFRATGKLAGKNNKARASAASASLSAFQLDPKKKAERANRFNTEYVEKVVLGKEDDSHRRVKAWGGDKVTHNADEAIAKFLERKRKAALSDAKEKGVAAQGELVKRAVCPKLLNLALRASSKNKASIKTAAEAAADAAAAAAGGGGGGTSGGKRKGGKSTGATAAKKKFGKWSL